MYCILYKMFPMQMILGCNGLLMSNVKSFPDKTITIVMRKASHSHFDRSNLIFQLFHYIIEVRGCKIESSGHYHWILY